MTSKKTPDVQAEAEDQAPGPKESWSAAELRELLKHAEAGEQREPTPAERLLAELRDSHRVNPLLLADVLEPLLLGGKGES